MPFGCFSEDVAFACHFVATRPPPPSHSVGVLVCSIDYTSKKLADYSASYPFNS